MTYFQYDIANNEIDESAGEVGGISPDFTHYTEKSFGVEEIYYRIENGKIVEIICEAFSEKEAKRSVEDFLSQIRGLNKEDAELNKNDKAYLIGKILTNNGNSSIKRKVVDIFIDQIPNTSKFALMCRLENLENGNIYADNLDKVLLKFSYNEPKEEPPTIQHNQVIEYANKIIRLIGNDEKNTNSWYFGDAIQKLTGIRINGLNAAVGYLLNEKLVEEKTSSRSPSYVINFGRIKLTEKGRDYYLSLLKNELPPINPIVQTGNDVLREGFFNKIIGKWEFIEEEEPSVIIRISIDDIYSVGLITWINNGVET
jgi:hypothetical protein